MRSRSKANPMTSDPTPAGTASTGAPDRSPRCGGASSGGSHIAAAEPVLHQHSEAPGPAQPPEQLDAGGELRQVDRGQVEEDAALAALRDMAAQSLAHIDLMSGNANVHRLLR